MGPSVASFNDSPKKSEVVYTSASPVSTGKELKPNAPTKLPYVTSALRRAHTVAQGKNIARKTNDGLRPVEEKAALPLVRSKDSHELLRGRTVKHIDSQKNTRKAFAGSRASSHFTVGNVGQNGKIFLRPIRNQSRKRSTRTPAAPSPGQSKPDYLHLQGPDGRDKNGPSRWSNSQLSELRFEDTGNDEDAASVDSDMSRSSSHPQNLKPTLQRAHSFSTISEQRSASCAGDNNEFRVVIDRADDRPKSAGGYSLQQLEVPILDHHLGITRVNTTNVLLPSSTQSLEVWNSTRNTYLNDAVHHSFAPSIFSGVSAMDLSRGAAVSPEPVVYDPVDTIKPSIFESLVTVMDDESVVRYVSGTKNISAATPARIVAQISSESFMDYELVSDFFLTFRPYLSAGSLLSLLLARLQWAINRLQEDGRIIRIRTFAALRHWILNYFVDDFVPEFKLRIHFCETINRLYDSVKARQGGGVSDLKILIDLKRCWHGKCLAYWDIPDHHIPYNSPDRPIDPGGDEPVAGDDLQNIAPTHGTHLPGMAENRNPPLLAHHDRKDSSATAKSMPTSTNSDWSAPAISCSLPPKSPKRHSMPFSMANAPHPVPVLPRHVGSSSHPPTAPISPMSARRIPCYGHSHKRSGSFSDSFRDDRAPISLPHLDNRSATSAQEPCYLGGLIRGELYPPVESYTTMMAPPSPPLPSVPTGMRFDRRSTDGASKPATSASGVKTIIGSIRRALNGKTPTPGAPTRLMNGPSTRGRTSALPSHVASGLDLHRDKKAALLMKRPTRIDLLCDEALRQYRQASGDPVDELDNELQPRLGDITADESRRSFLLPPNDRTHSRVTGGSESIVIVDDTGASAPVMSGAVGTVPLGLDQPPLFLSAESTPTTPKAPTFLASSRASTMGADEYSLPIYYDETSARQSRRNTRFNGQFRPASIRSFSIDRGSSYWKKSSPSTRLRKYASFQSGFSRQRPVLENESEFSESDANSSILDLAKPAGPTLRRRPGGDLRRMQTDIDTRPVRDSASAWSDVTYQSSVAGSTNTMGGTGSRPQTSLVPPKPRFSLLKTHSSQLIRRSFESAIARFAQIPDDDDGGIESALLKLEGKWTGDRAKDAANAAAGPSHPQEHAYKPSHARDEMVPHDHYPRGSTPVKSNHKSGGDSAYHQAHTRVLGSRPYSESVVDSEDSYSSIPLLERGLSDESMKKQVHNEASGPRVAVRAVASHSDIGSSHPSIDLVRKTESMKRIPRGSTLPVPHQRTRASRLSGLSSEVSVDVIDANEAAGARLSFDTRSLNGSSAAIPPHPLAHPPSPPMTVRNHRSVQYHRSSLNADQVNAQHITPDPSPVNKTAKRPNLPSLDMQHVSGDILCRSEEDHHLSVLTAVPGAQHVPFVLSCESHILAQQFTLIEMAALGEVDWRDLVDMKWNSGPPFTTSWVQFLVDEDRRGIDLVVGRFNLMVKWVLSEIVLTLDTAERARTISKFIHTAAHARMLCNYATMLQIAIALTSTDCSRLQSTWALVSLEDRRTLKDMELLIQPVRNFHDLRVEMETANVQDGCIPFVGLYIHDLTYNAQKPAQVAATREGEPLINFERYRTTARIVKSLLRLIDASTRYNIEPVPGIVERVLWIASLSEDQIQIRSKLLV